MNDTRRLRAESAPPAARLWETNPELLEEDPVSGIKGVDKDTRASPRTFLSNAVRL